MHSYTVYPHKIPLLIVHLKDNFRSPFACHYVRLIRMTNQIEREWTALKGNLAIGKYWLAIFSLAIFSLAIFSLAFLLTTFHLPEIFPFQKIYFMAPSVRSKRLVMNDFKIVFALPMRIVFC
jgi:hypothetical protein